MAKVYINIVHILFWPWVGAKVTLSFILLVLIHKNAEACWHFWYNLCNWVGLIYFWQLICLNFSIYYLFSLLCICSHFFLELLAVFEGLCRIYRSISCWFTFASRIASFHFSLGSLFEINKFCRAFFYLLIHALCIVQSAGWLLVMIVTEIKKASKCALCES